jgi:hypothetical protein
LENAILSLKHWSQKAFFERSQSDFGANTQGQDWPVEINGLHHEHISSEILEDLGEPALVVGEE